MAYRPWGDTAAALFFAAAAVSVFIKNSESITIGFLFGLRYALLCFIYLLRKPVLPRKDRDLIRFSNAITGIAYLSALLPLFYDGQLRPLLDSSTINRFLSIAFLLGNGLSYVATVQLGTSFGIKPANRGKVTNGLYRSLRHPMYIGYAVSEIALVCLSWSTQNLYLLMLSLSLYILRAAIENRVLQKESEHKY